MTTETKFKPTEIGLIPEDWEVKTVEELYFINSGLSKPRNQFGFGYPFLSFKEIFNNFSVPKKLTELVNTSEKERNTCSIKRGDVFLTRTSETQNELGMSSVSLKNYENATFNGFAKRLRPKYNNIIPEYAVYYFRSKQFRKQVLRFSSLTTRASLNASMIKEMHIILPPLQEQSAIAKILSDLDSKIELIQKQNETLEKIGQAIFKQWFVDFEFPNEEGNPYKSFGGEMVESELGAIPKGWSVVMLGDLINILSGFAFKSINFVKNGEYRLVTILNVQNGSFIEKTKEGLKIIPKNMPDYCNLKTGDILLSLTGNVGRVCHVIGEKFLLNQRVAKLQAKKNNHYGFVYFYFRMKPTIKLLESLSSGSAQQNLSPLKVSSLIKIIYSYEIIEKYSKIINPIILKLLINNKDILNLQKTRDLLLPKLMTGKIRVPLEDSQ